MNILSDVAIIAGTVSIGALWRRVSAWRLERRRAAAFEWLLADVNAEWLQPRPWDQDTLEDLPGCTGNCELCSSWSPDEPIPFCVAPTDSNQISEGEAVIEKIADGGWSTAITLNGHTCAHTLSEMDRDDAVDKVLALIVSHAELQLAGGRCEA